jgi:hypothetical protein
MPGSLEVRFKIENGVDVASRQYRARRRKPAIEFLRPRMEE